MASGVSGSWSQSVPLVRVLLTYPRQWLASDLLAGISVCVVMIPSVIAYAELAGLTPVHGLYAALAAMVGYAGGGRRGAARRG